MDYWFYHLEHASIESVLPHLLEKTRAKGWTALVKMSEDRLEYMDKYLWTYRDNSFLPHGRDSEPMGERQPICLTSDTENADKFECVFLLDQTEIELSDRVERCIIIIEGQKAESVSFERARWKRLQENEAILSYWQQNDSGEWKKKA